MASARDAAICQECGNDMAVFMHEKTCSKSMPSASIVREYLPPDIRQHHLGGNHGGCSCGAHDALDELERCQGRVVELEREVALLNQMLEEPM